MKLLILHAHWNNRGDEAALRAFVDNFLEIYPDSEIKILLMSRRVEQFCYENDQRVSYFPSAFGDDFLWRRRHYPEIAAAYLSKGKIVLNKELGYFIDAVKWSDFVVHAPGGPSLGEIYRDNEKSYIFRLLFVKLLNKPYMFYAPSAGPFKNKFRNIIRRYIYNNASKICVREGISAEYVRNLGIKKDVIVTLDSAFQRDIDEDREYKKLKEYTELNSFLEENEKVIGITISDLSWNLLYKSDGELGDKIKKVFTKFIEHVTARGYSIIFIPQLFGQSNDSKYMSMFSGEKSFVMDDVHDCYFQQYIIGKLYAVVGMRYHSNIFSAKMGTPFVSVSYEQKMIGFMKAVGLEKYCIELGKLDCENLINVFNDIENNYIELKELLKAKHNKLKEGSYETTKQLINMIENRK